MDLDRSKTRVRRIRRPEKRRLVAGGWSRKSREVLHARICFEARVGGEVGRGIYLSKKISAKISSHQNYDPNYHNGSYDEEREID